VGIFGTEAGIASDILIGGEVILTILVYLGVRSIRRDRAGHVSNHRTLMLTVLAFNLVLLLFFVVMDLIKASNTVERGLTAPLWIFVPLLIIHLFIAISALTIAIRAWLIARKGVVRDGKGKVVSVTPDVRIAHRRISRYYPPMWYATLTTGLILYLVLYVVPF
jgi:uncharacterized membrane protein YozB (DUF420 family)